MRSTGGLTFRMKILAIVGIAAVAILMMIATNALLTRRVEQEISAIQQRYLPRVGLAAQLDARVERIWRGLKDAVAGSELDALDATATERDAFVAQLEAARGSVGPAAVARLTAAVTTYHAVAVDVSRRMIAEESGAALEAAVAAMQAHQAALTADVAATTRFDRATLDAAFAAARAAQAAGRRYQIWIGLGFLAIAVLLSLAVSRGMLRSLAELAAGFRRFGASDFARPIPVRGGDAIGEVAQVANQMAADLDRTQHLLLERTDEARAANRELEAFSYSVAHDLRAPLRGMNGFASILLEDHGAQLDADGRGCVREILDASARMAELIDALLALARVTRGALEPAWVDLAELSAPIVKRLAAADPTRAVEVVVDGPLVARIDPALGSGLLDNLLGNAWKFTARSAAPRIELGKTTTAEGPAFFVRDNGAGFDMAHAAKLFAPFQRLHTTAEFPGTGIGLATVQRIVARHGGRIWAEGAVGGGATFYFVLPERGMGEPR